LKTTEVPFGVQKILWRKKKSVMPTEVATMCFHTHDAIEVHEASYTFEMPLGRLREDAVKVALASCEFPMTQWTIEEEWCRLWMNEGIRLAPQNNFLDVARRLPNGGEESVWRIRLPPRLNRVRRVTRRRGELVVECENEHGLGALQSEHVKLLGDLGGDVTLDRARLILDSEHTFRVEACSQGIDARYVCVATIPSHKHLCDALTAAAHTTLPEGTKMHFQYDGAKDHVVLTYTVPLPGTQMRLLPSPLVAQCGLSTYPTRCITYTQTCACEETTLWDYVEIPTGHYAPCHRSMCVGQPLRFGPELESAVNRLYFPLGGGSTVAGGDGTHLLIFSDPDGHILSCPIPSGRYSSTSLARHLEVTMTERTNSFGTDASFTVFVDENDHFVLSCERRVEGKYRPASFALLFNHPLCIDGARLGFGTQPTIGSSMYVAPLPTKSLCTEPGTERTVSNLVRVSEVVSQKRFRLHSATPPTMVGVFTGRSRSNNASTLLLLKTYVNKSAFAHGYQAGDVVRIVAYPEHVNDETTVRATTAVLPVECGCVVHELANGKDPCVLALETPALDGLDDEGTCVHILSEVEPFNLHFAKARSLPPHLMGFRKGSVLWGVDGTTRDKEHRLLPPFEAPYCHCLDHVDYVLMTFSESSGVNFEHSFSNENKLIFCKLSLYPLFREERMLPRDTSLLSNNLSRFTLSFWNPDMKTPYKFHGAQFSFSLNFVSVIPE
jgi:hypothetical protein